MQDKYTKSARGKECQIRIPGVCNHRPATTVFCHLNGGGGTKHLSIHGAYGCSDCHDLVDGRTQSDVYDGMDIKWMHYEGMVRTQKIMVKEGILKL
jgi:hypothetical protein